MKFRFIATLLVLTFLALSVVQVLAGDYGETIPTPIIFSSGTPALSGSQMSGIIVIAYADYASSASLSPPLVPNGPIVLRLCGTLGFAANTTTTTTTTTATTTTANATGISCVNVVANLTDVGPYVTTNKTRPGMENYLYSFTVPSSPTGLVTITVPAKSLVDDFAKHFPAVDTQIGTYTTPGTSPTSSNPSIPGLPSSAQPAGTYKVAPELNTPKVSTGYIPLGFLILAMAACGLILSRKH
jgi:hypothetical protein